MHAAVFPSNAPEGYVCPICVGIRGVEDDRTLIRASDIVYKDNMVTVFINSFFVGNNEGHAIVVPNEHYESVYGVPERVGAKIFEITKNVSIAIKRAYQADGVTIRQNNEPAGDQHAFHYHQHIFPRYVDDGYNSAQPAEKRMADPQERAEYAQKLNAELSRL